MKKRPQELEPTAGAEFDPHADRLREECGVFGIFGHPDAAAVTALGLHALQHRGQEAAGIVTFDGKRFHSERRLGLVGDTFARREVIDRLPGNTAVGHVRYSTTGETVLRNVQPLFAELEGGGFAIGHNGNLTNGIALRRNLVHEGAMMQSTTDTEVILHLVARARRNRFVDRFIEGLRQLEGAYAFVGLTNKKLVGARDPLGIRPLVIGKLDGCPILASETCALDIIGAQYVRDVENGEVVVFDEDGAQSHKPFPPMAARPCIFEYVYFSRPDSIVGGRNVYDVRKTMGAELAREAPAPADVIVPVPDSGVPAAIGFAQESGIPYELGIIRNHYVGRTFIQPTQADPRPGRAHEALGQSRRGRGQTHRPDRRLDRARHHLAQDRADDARCRRHGSAFPHRLAADQASGLLRHRHARARQVAGRHPRSGRHAGVYRRGFARFPVGRRHLSRHGLREARSGAPAIHRPLLHRRLPDGAHRPRRARGEPAAIVAAGGSDLASDAKSLEVVTGRTLSRPVSRRWARHDDANEQSCPTPKSPAKSRSSPAPRAASARRWRWNSPQAGAHVVAVARTVGGLEELDDKIKAAGGSATLVPLDMKDSDGIARLALALNERYQRLDVLVGNAGILTTPSPLGHIEQKAWDDIIAVNVTANWQLIRLFDPLLKLSDAGRAVFVTSGLAAMARAYFGAYAVSKAALEVLVRTLRRRMRRHQCARQSVQPRPDAHAHDGDRVSRRRSGNAADAGRGRQVHRAAVHARLQRKRQGLRFPREEVFGVQAAPS